MAVHGSSPLTPQSQKAFETAVKLNIPVIIHGGNGVPCALPSLAIPVAKAYPELSMVLAHSGAGMYGAEALIAAQQCPNITLEPSLTTVMDIPSFIRKLGAERVMFGTDIPLNASVELGKYKALHLTEEPYAWVYEGTRPPCVPTVTGSRFTHAADSWQAVCRRVCLYVCGVCGHEPSACFPQRDLHLLHAQPRESVPHYGAGISLGCSFIFVLK